APPWQGRGTIENSRQDVRMTVESNKWWNYGELLGPQVGHWRGPKHPPCSVSAEYDHQGDCKQHRLGNRPARQGKAEVHCCRNCNPGGKTADRQGDQRG